MIKRYAAKFQKLGVLLFKTGKPPRASAGGRPERYALLNEDQAYFLLNLSRNTERVVDLKLKLIIAFRDARNRCVLHSHTYLPGYHELHDEVALLAQRAKEAGSQTDEALFHININKLVNKGAGIEAGRRDTLTHMQKLMMINAQAVIRNAVHRAIQAGENHQTAHQQAKGAVERFMASAGYLLAGV